MKKAYIVKNVMKAVNRYLVYGWDIDHCSKVSFSEEKAGKITSVQGDIFYFHYYECEGLYEDFIIRFGHRYNGEEIQDIDFLRVVKDKGGKTGYYKYEFCTPLNDLCLAEIVADVIQAIQFLMRG